MRMVHRGDGPSLTFETLTETAVTRLDGDQPIEARVSRFPDLTHAASAKGGQNLIPAESRARRASHGSGWDYRRSADSGGLVMENAVCY